MSETKSSSKGTALYYPYIHPRNVDELKASLIYWDRVRRIVPDELLEGRHVRDDNDDVRLLTDQGLLLATNPEPYEERATEKFLERIEPQSANLRIDIDTARNLAQRNGGTHLEKLGFSVISRLIDLGIGHCIDEWMVMREEVAASYMFCLASEMSSRIGAPLFCDSNEDAALGQSLLFEPSSAVEVSDVLLRVGIKLPSPNDLHDVSVRKFAEFAKNRSGERQRFRKVVEGIVEEARSITDRNAIEDYLADEGVKIAEAVKDLRDTLDELRVGAAKSMVSITAPAAAGATAALAVLFEYPVSAGILAATGLAVSAISCLAETRGKLRQAKTSAPYHYLISIEKKFGFDATVES